MVPVKSKRPVAAPTSGLRIVHVASEVAPWSQTGGLAHVVDADHVGVGDAGDGLCLANQSRTTVADEVVVEDLDRHPAD